MTEKKKLAWIGDIDCSTGFARVSDAVLRRLHNVYDVVVLGCNYHGNPRHGYPFPIYPATDRFRHAPFAEETIREFVLKENPDIILTINDIWIVCDQYSRIADLHQQKKFKFVAYVPCDAKNWSPLFSGANPFDALISYTNFGVVEMKKAGYNGDPYVIPHGVDTKTFFPIDIMEARKSIGIPQDKFIVFNGNRNQPRKRIDLTIRTFAQFAIDKPDTLLYLHMGTRDMGWPVMQIFSNEMNKVGINPGGRLILTSGDTPTLQAVPSDHLNVIYNTADVGISTTYGEGWGLVSVEQAACGVPQIVPNHTACKEIFEGYGDLIDIEHIEICKDFGRELEYPSVTHLVELLNKHYYNVGYREERGKSCYRRATMPEFQWDNIAKQFEFVIDEVINKKEEMTLPSTRGFVASRTVDATKKKGKKNKKKKTEDELVLV